ARELVRLHADQPDHAEIVVLLELRDDVPDLYARVGLVHRGNVDRNVVAEHVALRGIHGQRVDAGERVGGDRRARPLDHIAVGVVMRRLDQHELKAALFTWLRSKHTSPPYPSTAASLT